MSDKFVASNGIGVQLEPDDDAFLTNLMGAYGKASFRKEVTKALREFFQHERDEELGRWRWPESTSIVVYEERPGVLRILEEEGGTTWGYYRGESNPHCPTPVADAGEAYLVAHPEPKPWHDAKPGEVWLIGVPTGPTFEFSAMTAVEHDGKIAFSNPGSDEWVAPTYEPLSARRIWPEVSDVQ